ncbi:MAG: RNA polymerase sigma factor [Patescibacteria group bacterium]|jgi:RNA polymerase sigma-70 factor (ECF subfamily)
MVKPGSFQEKILIGKLKLKDKEAFSKIYDLYLDKIYRFVYFKVSSVPEAEDLTSQIFLKIWQLSLEDKIKTEKSFQAFLYKVARNTVIDYYRDSRNRKQTIPLEEAANTPDEKTAAQDRDMDRKIEKEELAEKIKKLKSEYQEIIILHYLNELSIKEIADILKKRKGNVRVMLHRALKALKEGS